MVICTRDINEGIDVKMMTKIEEESSFQKMMTKLTKNDDKIMWDFFPFFRGLFS